MSESDKALCLHLEAMANDETKFEEYGEQTAVLLILKYSWYYMPSSIHEVLIYGASISTNRHDVGVSKKKHINYQEHYVLKKILNL